MTKSILLTASALLASVTLARSQPAADPQQSPTAAQMILQQAQTIEAEVQARLAASGNPRNYNGSALNGNNGSALNGANVLAPGLNFRTASYCFITTTTPATEVIVFTAGDYIFTTNPNLYQALGSACPDAKAVEVYADPTSAGTWQTFYILHN